MKNERCIQSCVYTISWRYKLQPAQSKHTQSDLRMRTYLRYMSEHFVIVFVFCCFAKPMYGDNSNDA